MSEFQNIQGTLSRIRIELRMRITTPTGGIRLRDKNENMNNK